MRVENGEGSECRSLRESGERGAAHSKKIAKNIEVREVLSSCAVM